MESINFKITEQDIKEYIDRVDSNEYNGGYTVIRFREAMFVNYMKNENELTAEKLEILLYKLNDISLPVNGLYCAYNGNEKIESELMTFHKYIKNLKIDYNAIMHMLIPTIKFYEKKVGNIALTNGNIEKYLPGRLESYNCHLLSNAIEDYQIAGKIAKKDEEIVYVDDILIDKNECEIELCAYTNMFGKRNVDKIKRLVREDR